MQSRLRRRFDRAAPGFDAAAALHTEIRTRLLSRLDIVRITPKVILDLGAGTGHASRALLERYKSSVLAVDVSAGMLREARKRQPFLRKFLLLSADAGALPLSNESVDLVFSNLMLPWADPDAVFREVRRVLRPNGLFTFTALGPDTLRELRQAWAQCDEHERVNDFIDMHDLGDALMRARFAEPVLDVEYIRLTYPEPSALLRELKTIGSMNLTARGPRSLTARGRLERLQRFYPRDGQGRATATVEVVFGHAWSAGGVPEPRGNEARVPIGAITRRVR